MWEEKSTAWRKLTIPKEESLLLAQFAMVSFQRFFSFLDEFFELGLFGEGNRIDALQTIFCGVTLPVTCRVLQKFECFGESGVLNMRTCAKVDEIPNSVNTSDLSRCNLRLNQLGFVFVIREEVKCLLPSAL